MNNTTVIVIGRQFGSGGRAIGKLIAEKLGIPCYDKELIKHIAEESGFSPEILADYDEKPTNKDIVATIKAKIATNCIFLP